jgi:outer membrane protein assembly factor BamB
VSSTSTITSLLRGFLVCLIALTLAGCDRKSGSKSDTVEDGKVVPAGDLKDDPKVLSAPILDQPIYECTETVFVRGFVPNADIQVFVAGNPAPIGQGKSPMPSLSIKTSITFAVGQVLTATQTVNGQTSAPSEAVTVRSVKADYPNGLPKPRVDPPPLYRCGKATGARDVLPGSRLEFQSEPALAGGGFGPAATIATVNGSGPAQWATVNPAFGLGDRVRVQYEICADKSPLSNPEIVQQEPSTIPPPTVDQGYEGQEIIVVRNTVHGALLDVFANVISNRIGGSATPGGAGGQQVRVSPPVNAGDTLFAVQALCSKSPPGPGVVVKPCSELPAPRIAPPSPGDTQVQVTESVPGAEIQIYANGQKIGDGGGSVINLIRELVDGETVSVLQILGKCRGLTAYQVPVKCRASGDAMACSADWPSFGHDSTRRGEQPKSSALSDPNRVRTLKIGWTFTPPEPGHFRASPVVYKETVYVGMGNTAGSPYFDTDSGRLYAIDANTGKLKWQYPPAGNPPLTSAFTCNNSSAGIAASAAIARIGKKQADAVIFAAPDRSLPPGFGSGRLFALNAATGAEIWKSPALAVLDGTSPNSTSQLHEQIGYSAPLVRNGKVYVGIANHCDNPIQNGRVVAVDLNTGTPVAGFAYQSTNTRGGGVWSAVAAGADGELYITTGNTRSGNPGGEPRINRGLGMLRLDPATGAVIWKFQPVPFDLDNDPDWAAGPIASKTGCGHVAVSTQKDGWSYAVRAGDGKPGSANMAWQFPPTGVPFNSNDGTVHSDDRYLVRGAVWNDVFITMTAGENVVSDTNSGFGRLHGLNICGGDSDRVRWLFDVPSAVIGSSYQLGPPTVTGGVIFVGTASGHLVVFGDPSVVSAVGQRCSNPAVPSNACVANGFKLVSQPSLLADVSLGAGRILTEPALAHGRVFVSTEGGKVFMLEP